jgi:tRNA(Ile)-lysidine synthase
MPCAAKPVRKSAVLAAVNSPADDAAYLTFSRTLDRLLQEAPHAIAVAVSGGSDSLALTFLANAWAKQRSVSFLALTIDHALRPESAAEAQQVASWLQEAGITYHMLRWEHGDISGNLPDAAREARYRLLAHACRLHGIGICLLGHTEDDQAETIAMRLARNSGPVGLSGMSARRHYQGILFARPLLNQRRHDLREWLQSRQQRWIDDPSNECADYERVAIRQQLAQHPARHAELLAIGKASVPERQRIDETYANFVKQHVTLFETGHATINYTAFAEMPGDLQHYILKRILTHLSGELYPPRHAKIARLAGQLIHSHFKATLQGCVVEKQGDKLLVYREAKALPAAMTLADKKGSVRWDNRFEIHWELGEALPTAATLAPLGAGGYRLLRDDKLLPAADYPRAALETLPAIWALESLIAVPHIFPTQQARFGTFRCIFNPVKALVEEPFCCIDGARAEGRIFT